MSKPWCIDDEYRRLQEDYQNLESENDELKTDLASAIDEGEEWKNQYEELLECAKKFVYEAGL